MKKIGEYTARGRVKTGTQEKLQIFDGRFDTGYRVVEFVVWGHDFSGSQTGDVLGRLMTESNTNSSLVNFMDAADNTQIGWAGQSAAGGTWAAGEHVLDPDNMIIEDLYLMCVSANDTDDINYMIKMEKYDITDWQGALGMVRNRSQA
jgi:hypothetical protein